jgi:hypothetical protein
MMLSTLLVIAVLGVVAGAVHVVGAAEEEPTDPPEVMRVDLSDRE